MLDPACPLSVMILNSMQFLSPVSEHNAVSIEEHEKKFLNISASTQLFSVDISYNSQSLVDSPEFCPYIFPSSLALMYISIAAAGMDDATRILLF